MVPWQNGDMRRSEIPNIEVQFLGVPQNKKQWNRYNSGEN